MALSRIALLLGVTCVAGFSSAPGSLTGRSSGDYECTPPPCEDDGGKPDVSEIVCAEMDAPMSYKGENKKACKIGTFCYFKKGSFCQCEKTAAACEFYPTSSDCKQHAKSVEDGACPALQAAIGTTFCKDLDMTKHLPPGKWCGSLRSEEECDGAFLTYTSGPTGDETFQPCFWDSDKGLNGKCRKYKRSGYDVVTFCDPFCKVDKSVLHDLGSEKCNTGLLTDTSEFGLFNRLRSESACTGSYTSPTADVDNGCEWLAGTSRCDPAFYCDPADDLDPTDDDPYTGCFPACNCQSPLTTGCAPVPVMCCDRDACTPCDELDPPVEFSIQIFKAN